jgi:serine phosphatase RsbU (regulator of sigma subunit)
MKLRLKLILAFLLLSIVPMSVVVVYSYISSQRAFRRAVETEAQGLAEEMGRRMDMMRHGLNRYVSGLSRLPFRQMMGKRSTTFDLKNDPVFVELMRRVGEEGALVESLEFVPAHSLPPRPPDPALPEAHGPESSAPPRPGEPPPIVIYLSRLLGGGRENAPAWEGEPMGPSPAGARSLAGPGQPPAPPPSGNQAGVDAEAAARFAVEMVKKRAEVVQKAMKSWSQLSEAERAALEEKRRQVKLLLGREFGSEVRSEGELIGTVKAQVSPEKILRQVLLKAQRQPDEIAFALDAQGKIHTVDPSHGPLLRSLSLKEAAQNSGQAAPNNSELKNWIVVTRKDAESGLSLGIARPIRQSLEEFRRTAVRNFGYGMGVVGLALLGILPLSGRLTRNLTALTKSVEKLAKGDLTVQLPVRSHDELGQLAQTFNRMALELRESQQKLVERERLKKELEMCRRIQEELLPKGPLQMSFGEVRGVSIPALELGGDFFNYFQLPGGDLALLVGDVSGKGVPAALLMANLQATLRARLPLSIQLAELADQLDREIAESTPPELFLTLFMAVLDSRQQLLRYVNAGHNPQYVLRSGGLLESLSSTGRPLGLLPGAGYQEKQVALHEGDSVFLYTDGLVEAENAAGEELGAEPLERVLAAERSAQLDTLLTSVEAAVRHHRGTAEPRDDATMLALRVTVAQGVTVDAAARLRAST